MCFGNVSISVESPPKVNLNSIPAGELHNLIQKEFPGVDIDLDDGIYYYPSWDDWGKILAYVQDEKRMRKYVPEKFDCDNFAHYVAIMVSYYFECNCCGVSEGLAGLDYHKWNIIFDGDSFTQLESQVKQLYYEADDVRYRPVELYFG